MLSAIPREYVTNVTKIRLAARMPENKVQKILERLIASRFVDEFEGLQGNRVYRLTEAGKNHPQRDNLPAAQRCHASLLNQTVFAKCFQQF